MIAKQDNGAPPRSHGQNLLSAFLGIAVDRKGFSVVTGLSGSGKSHILKDFIHSFGDDDSATEVLYFKARKGMGVSDMHNTLCGLFRVSRSGSCDRRLENCLAVARGHLLIVDEADLLVADRRTNLVASYVEVFRELHEAGCAVILIGLPVLSEQISRCCETYVFSRIRLWHSLPMPSRLELERYWLHITSDIPGAAAETKRVAQDALKLGLFRYLTELAQHTLDFNGDVGAARTLLYSPEI
jgi:type II secretory pathway predicted ATPase ExeA